MNTPLPTLLPNAFRDRRRGSLAWPLALVLCNTAVAQYCTPTFDVVEPICKVSFAGLDHDSPGDVPTMSDWEDFTAQTATVERGRFYPILVYGNTKGDFYNAVTVFFDWNQDGVFETAQWIGGMSNAVCNNAAFDYVTVPANAALGTTRMRVIKNYDDEPMDPCGAYYYGQAEDYSVHVVEPSLPWYCTEFQITTDVEPICYVYFSWINSSSSPGVNGSPAVEDFTQSPGVPWWADGPGYMAVVEQGRSYPIIVSGNTAGNYTNYITAFFDWDQDGTYETAENIGSIQNGSCGSVEAVITVPPNAALGITRMRIVKAFGAQPTNPCGTYAYGQAEDYTVHVSAPSTPEYCTGFNINWVEPICNVTFAGIDHDSPATATDPALEDFTHIAGSVDPGRTYPITVSGNTAGPFTTYITAFFDWDRNGSFETAVQVGSITDVECGSTAPMDITVPPDAVMGVTRMRIVKNFGSWPTDPCSSYGFGQAEDYSIYVNPPHYCSPIGLAGGQGGNNVLPICSVTFADIDNESSPVAGGSPMLENFTSIVAHVQRGATYPISVTGNTDGEFTDHVVAFFDWDQDSVFEATVTIGSLTNSSCNNVITAMVTVPADAPIGTTRMRVIKNWDEVPLDPCAMIGYGQAEDYSVQVDFGTGLAAQASESFRLVPNPAHDRIELMGPKQGLVRLEVLNLTGRRVMEAPPGGAVHIGGLAPGIYIMQVWDAQERAVARLRFVKH